MNIYNIYIHTYQCQRGVGRGTWNAPQWWLPSGRELRTLGVGFCACHSCEIVGRLERMLGEGFCACHVGLTCDADGGV